MSNKYNFEIYIDLGDGYQLITNDNCVKTVEPTSILRENENMFYRLQIGEITFQNVPEYKIFDLIDSVDFTTEMKVKIIYGDLEVEGYFAKIDCSFDNDKLGKIITAKPAIEDQYRRFLENYETEIELTDNDWTYETATSRLTSDILTKKSVWTTRDRYGSKILKDNQWDEVNSPGEVDFADFFYESGEPNLTLLTTPPYNATDGLALNIQQLIDSQDDQWELCELTVWRGSSWYVPFTTKRVFYVTCSFASERTFEQTSDGTITGDLVEPVGEGWIEESETPVFKGTRGTREGTDTVGVYGYYFNRKPFNGAYGSEGLNDWNLTDTESSDGTSGGGADFFWTHKRTTKINYPISDEDDGVFELGALIDLKEMLTYMYQQSHEDLATKEVKSVFFWNDDEGDFSFMYGLVGCNYITKLPNELNNLKCIHTYGLKTDIDESDEDEDSQLPLTIKQVIEDLQKYFPIKYHIDDDLNLHLEHVKYYDLISSSIDISTKKEIELTNKTEFDTSDLFDEKIFGQMNAGYIDFKNNSIEFAQAVSNNRNKDITTEVTTEVFTTDLRYCLENPNDLENGLILIIASDGEVVNDLGYISETEQVNGALSLSQLLIKYWTYEGVWVVGEINGTETNFTKAVRCKLGTDELQFRGIDPCLFFTTQIGVGLIDNGSIDFGKENTSVNLRYRHSSSTTGDSGFYLAWGDNEGEIFDFGNTET